MPIKTTIMQMLTLQLYLLRDTEIIVSGNIFSRGWLIDFSHGLIILADIILVAFIHES